ncbi:hypothetical protein [Bradyrhizobium centrosematis]|uniref:hypothetical protein n=1 Tax=Bradyrhizobium centrosematis TaxID=1300039 RepID=UPI002168B4BC|nr:hypothetical protein [Bradyrhizobium centrosematis]MCS3764964.1 hypothetical protein [Bradyrhizobium centrosematis]MCS3777760.1 hypothetical protein [Bradyrhizobium centrosematis]
MRLKDARARRVREAAFAIEQVRFKDWISSGGGLWAKAARWSSARRQVTSELKVGMHVHHVLIQCGYRLIEDHWDQDGRRTYVSDEDADRDLLKDLEEFLAEHGWTKHPNILRAFTNVRLGGLLEMEIGGPDTTGHLLHLKVRSQETYAER